MRYIFIGSYPLCAYTNGLIQYNDIDILTDDIERAKQNLKEEYNYGPTIKFEYFKAEDELLKWLNDTPRFPSMNDLLTLKLSHMAWDINWKKHAEQAVLLMNQCGATPNSDLFNRFHTYWKRHHKKKQVNLNKSNDEFFGSAVDRKYIHDDLHEAVKTKKHPMYWYIKEDRNSAKTSNALLDKLSPQDKIMLCKEEAAVVALERFLIPSNFTIDPKVAVRKALWKLCTSMTSGLFCKTILFNLHHLWDSDLEFVWKFNKAYFGNQLRKIGEN